MKYSVETLPGFDRQLKKLTKKYKSLKKDFEEFLSELRQNPTIGADLGNGVHKVRMAISDKGKGKSLIGNSELLDSFTLTMILGRTPQ